MKQKRTFQIFSVFLLIAISLTSIRCSKLIIGRQVDLTAAEIDPNVSPINRPRPPKPIQLNDNSALISPTTPPVSSVITGSSGTSSPSSSSSSSSSNIDELNTNEQIQTVTQPTNIDDQKPIDKFCKCTEIACNCCRDFSLPLLPVRGPGCAKIQYLGDEKMSVQIKYGDIVLASRTINGKKSAPVCVGLPGGYNRFCARFYGLAKEKAGFKSCMSLELRAEDDVEAQLRVSCFKFGRKGFSVSEAEPIPAPIQTVKDEDEDYFFGLGGGGSDADDDDDAADDDDDDDDDEPVGIGASADADDDSADYDFRFIEEIFGSENEDDEEEKISTIGQTTSAVIEPQTKETTSIIDESKTIPLKKSKSNKKKTTNDDESYDMADFVFGVLNLF